MFSIVKKDEGPPGHDILIIQILEGKTNAGKIVWGRVTRHKHVNMCLIGALGFYLMARFDMTGEKFDFSDSISWFNQKLLVSRLIQRTLTRKCKADSKHISQYGKRLGPAKYIPIFL
jgi:hypothetical protein